MKANLRSDLIRDRVLNAARVRRRKRSLVAVASVAVLAVLAKKHTLNKKGLQLTVGWNLILQKLLKAAKKPSAFQLVKNSALMSRPVLKMVSHFA